MSGVLGPKLEYCIVMQIRELGRMPAVIWFTVTLRWSHGRDMCHFISDSILILSFFVDMMIGIPVRNDNGYRKNYIYECKFQGSRFLPVRFSRQGDMK